MKRRFCFQILWLFVALGASQAFATNVAMSRAGQSEVYLFLTYWGTDTATIPNLTLPTVPPGPGIDPKPVTSDLNFDFKNTVMWGFGGGYHVNDLLAIRGELQFGSPEYEMRWNNTKITGEAWVNTGKLNLDLNILKNRPFTPFVTAGIGYMYIDTGIPSGPPSYSIWWDYFWGPVVVGTQPTHSDTYFTYNAAIGVRWDVGDKYAMRFQYGTNWVDATRGTINTYEAQFSFSWKY